MTTKAKTYDQYFTPADLADKVVAAFTIPTPKQIADFAVGDGKLLCAAQKRWPSIQCTAIDIDGDVIAQLKASYPKWKSYTCDFTDSDARKKPLTKRKRTVLLPAIALNPPFSIQKGKIRVRKVIIADTVVKCSPSLAFVVDALAYLEEGGQLVAIVPQGIINNAQDAIARQLLKQHYGFEIVELIPQTGFKDCSPHTAIVRFTAGVSSVVAEEPITVTETALIGRLLRGSISNTTIENSDHLLGLPFIHTTDLADGKLQFPKKRIFLSDVVFASGPAVLIPRVGKPSIHKIALLPNGMEVVLSDCVMAVECLTLKDAEELRQCLVTEWSSLEQAYGGTCARYISVSTLANFLKNMGCKLVPCLKGLKNNLEVAVELLVAA